MKNYDAEFAIRQTITKEVREYVQNGGKIKWLASKAGLYTKTVSNIAYMVTKQPRFHTIVAIGEALGYEVTMQKRLYTMVADPRNVVPMIGKKRK